MDARLPWAVHNNAKWCDLVCRFHGIETRFDPDLWSTAQRSPQFYPDAVTLRPHLGPEAVLAAISLGAGASVKDSFATLDLDRHGFDELFEARWLAREPGQCKNQSRSWTVVETEACMGEWIAAAGLTGILGPELLRQPEVRFLAARDRHGICAGAIANVSGPVVGVSNVFAATIAEDEAWAGIPAAVNAVFPSAVLVGYERGASLRTAVAAGFRDIGPLRVWMKPD